MDDWKLKVRAVVKRERELVEMFNSITLTDIDIELKTCQLENGADT